MSFKLPLHVFTLMINSGQIINFVDTQTLEASKRQIKQIHIQLKVCMFISESFTGHGL